MASVSDRHLDRPHTDHLLRGTDVGDERPGADHDAGRGEQVGEYAPTAFFLMTERPGDSRPEADAGDVEEVRAVDPPEVDPAQVTLANHVRGGHRVGRQAG